MKKKIIKGLIMGASIVFTHYTADSYFSVLAALIVFVSFLLGYYAKNWWFPSVSTDGVLDWKDAASAIMVGLSAAIPESITQIVANNLVDWKKLTIIVGTVVFTYISATYMSNSKA